MPTPTDKQIDALLELRGDLGDEEILRFLAWAFREDSKEPPDAWVHPNTPRYYLHLADDLDRLLEHIEAYKKLCFGDEPHEYDPTSETDKTG